MMGGGDGTEPRIQHRTLHPPPPHSSPPPTAPCLAPTPHCSRSSHPPFLVLLGIQSCLPLPIATQGLAPLPTLAATPPTQGPALLPTLLLLRIQPRSPPYCSDSSPAPPRHCLGSGCPPAQGLAPLPHFCHCLGSGHALPSPLGVWPAPPPPLRLQPCFPPISAWGLHPSPHWHSRSNCSPLLSSFRVWSHSP